MTFKTVFVWNNGAAEESDRARGSGTRGGGEVNKDSIGAVTHHKAAIRKHEVSGIAELRIVKSRSRESFGCSRADESSGLECRCCAFGVTIDCSRSVPAPSGLARSRSRVGRFCCTTDCSRGDFHAHQHF